MNQIFQRRIMASRNRESIFLKLSLLKVDAFIQINPKIKILSQMEGFVSIIGKKLRNDGSIIYKVFESDQTIWCEEQLIEMSFPDEVEQILHQGEKSLRDRIFNEILQRRFKSFRMASDGNFEIDNCQQIDTCNQINHIGSFLLAPDAKQKRKKMRAFPSGYRKNGLESLFTSGQHRSDQKEQKYFANCEQLKDVRLPVSQKVTEVGHQRVKNTTIQKKIEKKIHLKSKSKMQERQEVFSSILNSVPAKVAACNEQIDTIQISSESEDTKEQSEKEEVCQGDEIEILNHVKYDECTNLLFFAAKNEKKAIYSFEKLKAKYPMVLAEYFRKIFLTKMI